MIKYSVLVLQFVFQPGFFIFHHNPLAVCICTNNLSNLYRNMYHFWTIEFGVNKAFCSFSPTCIVLDLYFKQNVTLAVFYWEDNVQHIIKIRLINLLQLEPENTFGITYGRILEHNHCKVMWRLNGFVVKM